MLVRPRHICLGCFFVCFVNLRVSSAFLLRCVNSADKELICTPEMNFFTGGIHMDKKYNFQETEKKLEKFWEEHEIYKYRKGEKIFSIHHRQPSAEGCILVMYFHTRRQK